MTKQQKAVQDIHSLPSLVLETDVLAEEPPRVPLRLRVAARFQCAACRQGDDAE